MPHHLMLAAYGILAFGCSPASPVAGPGDGVTSRTLSAPVPDGYACNVFRAAVSIPDGDPAGMTIGPLHTEPGRGLIGDVILVANFQHGWTGDLDVHLAYDADRDGVFEVEIPVELYRARAGTSERPEVAAYPCELHDTCYFRDGGPGSPVPRDASGARVTPDRNADPHTLSFFAFEGLPTGGDFYLIVSDGEPGQAGSVGWWGVYVKDGAPAVSVSLH